MNRGGTGAHHKAHMPNYTQHQDPSTTYQHAHIHLFPCRSCSEQQPCGHRHNHNPQSTPPCNKHKECQEIRHRHTCPHTQSHPPHHRHHTVMSSAARDSCPAKHRSGHTSHGHDNHKDYCDCHLEEARPPQPHFETCHCHSSIRDPGQEIEQSGKPGKRNHEKCHFHIRQPATRQNGARWAIGPPLPGFVVEPW